MSKEDLIRGLNEDLAAEWGTVIRYTQQASKSFGIMGAELREMFAREVQDELGHATFLTDVIVDLGGEPTIRPKEFPTPDGSKAMLELDLEMELNDVENYKKRAQQAEELGEAELKVRLEEMAADEAGHARELRRLLKGMQLGVATKGVRRYSRRTVSLDELPLAYTGNTGQFTAAWRTEEPGAYQATEYACQKISGNTGLRRGRRHRPRLTRSHRHRTPDERKTADPDPGGFLQKRSNDPCGACFRPLSSCSRSWSCSPARRRREPPRTLSRHTVPRRGPSRRVS